MFLQNKACSKVAVPGSGSSFMPIEFSPPRVAATMSGRSGGASLVLMIQCYIVWRKKISNRTVILPPYDDGRGQYPPQRASSRATRRRGHRDRALGGCPALDEH